MHHGMAAPAQRSLTHCHRAGGEASSQQQHTVTEQEALPHHSSSTLSQNRRRCLTTAQPSAYGHSMHAEPAAAAEQRSRQWSRQRSRQRGSGANSGAAEPTAEQRSRQSSGVGRAGSVAAEPAELSVERCQLATAGKFERSDDMSLRIKCV
jgi:hypothetical protein